MPDVADRMLQRLCNLQRARLVMLQQMKCHARSRFGADARQLAQRLGQLVERIGSGH